MDKFMTVDGNQIREMEKEFITTIMETFMKATGRAIKGQEMEKYFLQIRAFIAESLKMIKSKEGVNFAIGTVIYLFQ